MMTIEILVGIQLPQTGDSVFLSVQQLRASLEMKASHRMRTSFW